MKHATFYGSHLSHFRTSGVNIGHNLLLSVCLLLCDVVGRLYLLLTGIHSRVSELCLFKPSGYYMYPQFSIQQFYVLPTQCVYVFCVDLRINRDYFPIQH